MEQLDLIATAEPLMRIFLTANSEKKAWYELCLIKHQGGGFLIQKRSGSAGSKGSCEIWFRWKHSDALIKFRQIEQSKQRKTRKGRIYNEMEEN